MRAFVAGGMAGIALLLAQAGARADVFASPFRLGLRGGYAHLEYDDAAVSGYRQDSVALGAEALYYLLSHLNADLARMQGDLALTGEVRYTGPVVGTSLSGVNAGVFEGELGLAAVAPGLSNPFTLNLQGGLYVTRMFVTGSGFGYPTLYGPEVRTAVHLTRFSREAAATIYSAYARWAPLTDGTSAVFGPSSGGSGNMTGITVAARIPVANQFEWLKQGYERALLIEVAYTNLAWQGVSSRLGCVTLGFEW